MVAIQLPDGPEQVISLPKPETDFLRHVRIAKPQSWLTIRRDGLLLGGSVGSRTELYDVAAARLRELISPALISPSSLQWGKSRVVVWAELQLGIQGWDDRSGKPADFGKALDSATSLAVRPDGARVAVTNLSSISVVDVAKHRTVASWELPSGLRYLWATTTGVQWRLAMACEFQARPHLNDLADRFVERRTDMEPSGNRTCACVCA